MEREIVLTLNPNQHAALLAILREFAETAPEDQHEVLSEALPHLPIEEVHATWGEAFAIVAEATAEKPGSTEEQEQKRFEYIVDAMDGLDHAEIADWLLAAASPRYIEELDAEIEQGYMEEDEA